MSTIDRENFITNSENKQNGSFHLVNHSRGSGSSSLRRQSVGCFADQIDDDDDDAESASVSEAGDIGDRSFRSSRKSWSGRILSIDKLVESSTVIPISDDASQGAVSLNDATVPPLSLTQSVASRNENIQPKDNKANREAEDIWILEYISCLMVLGLFGILGVITRYYLQKLFGPGVIGATSVHSYMYPDLASNMVGSFLMGWLGVVFKGKISKFSNTLAIGLTTGYLGSLTTFSGWNQSLLELSSVEGRWVFAILSIVVGLPLNMISIIVGIDTAKIFQLLMRKKWGKKLKFLNPNCSWNVEGYPKSLLATLVLLFLFIMVWFICITFEIKKFRSSTRDAQLLLAFIVGPLGVWIRWFLARLNGRGLGKKSRLKWIPFGTLVANILASSLMAALALLKKMVRFFCCFRHLDFHFQLVATLDIQVFCYTVNHQCHITSTRRLNFRWHCVSYDLCFTYAVIRQSKTAIFTIFPSG
ncbi:OLC1v1028844C1 [Oldenlandia corymbosa var. corymbosa]|uniref:OLC1v1028844C1 n=1 Tax=Oldenlandia corymbosa var. corymbosa TaxID=529605 RepID=A0AAV1CFD5_OLDCO|nr:OLC1v1028844C1 [Oldenlandia corymbosa var. corymbosa]